MGRMFNTIVVSMALLACVSSEPEPALSLSTSKSKKDKYEALRKQKQQEEQPEEFDLPNTRVEREEKPVRSPERAKTARAPEREAKAAKPRPIEEKQSKDTMPKIVALLALVAVLFALPFTRNELLALLDNIEKLFALDRRSVVCFRVCTGVVIACDAIQRISEARSLYSDEGVFPRLLAIEEQHSTHWSLYFINGTVVWAYILLGLTVLASLSLAVGFRCRLSCILTWLLFTSMHLRNAHVLNGGDNYLRMCLLWAMFIPLDGVLSVDNYLRKKDVVNPVTPVPAKDYSCTSTASLGLLFQLVWVYLATGYHKDGDEWTAKDDYNAIYYALSVHKFAQPAGNKFIDLCHDPSWSASALGAARTGAKATLMLERWGSLLLVVGPLLPLLSQRLVAPRDCVRVLLLTAFAGLQIAIFLTIKVGPFPFMMLAGQALFLPPLFWNLFPVSLAKFSRLQGAVWGGAKEQAKSEGMLSTIRRLICLLLLSHTAVLNLRDLGVLKGHVPDFTDLFVDGLVYKQMWTMFGREIANSGDFLVMPAKLMGDDENFFDLQQAFERRTVDKHFYPAVDFTRIPALSSPFYGSFRWVAYLLELPPERQLAFGNYLCQEWNQVNKGNLTLDVFQIYQIEVAIRPPKGGANLRGARHVVQPEKLILTHVCDRSRLP